MSCELCGSTLTKRTISGIHLCEECFKKLTLLRNNDADIISFFLNEEIYDNATSKAKEYFTDIVNSKMQTIESIRQEEQRINVQNQILSQIKTTTGFNFEGYKITEYLEVQESEIALGTGFLSEFNASISDFFGTTAYGYTSKIKEAREAALHQLKINCLSVGANAIIGVDIDFFTIGVNMIVVCATGTAVKIEKN